MKKIRNIITVIAFTTIIACEPPVTFTEPQPPDTENLTTFPKKIRGEYLSSMNNSTLKITDNSIFRIYNQVSKIQIKQLDSNLRLSGDTIINLKTNEKSIVKRSGDTLIENIHCIDTIFVISEKNVLRKYKGYYFLNTLYEENKWEVIKIELSKGKLTVSSISDKEDFEQLKEITESAQDTIPQTFSMNKKQFKEFVKNDGFRESETFVKQK